jgi:addiction module HigA family antidote
MVNNRRRITADTTLRLGIFFGTSPEFWLNLQTHYDLAVACDVLPVDELEAIEAQRVA